jgi:hypothetical protein
MKNDLESIHERAQEIVRQMMHGIPTSLYDAEMEALDVLTNELLTSMGYEVTSYYGANWPPHEELKKALTNMYFLGKTYGKNEK